MRLLKKLLLGGEGIVLVASFLALCLLPLVDAAGRSLGGFHVPGSADLVQAVTLWLTFAVALDRYGMFRLGVSAKVYRATTDGDSFGTLPAIRTRDRWVNLAGEFTISF